MNHLFSMHNWLKWYGFVGELQWKLGWNQTLFRRNPNEFYSIWFSVIDTKNVNHGKLTIWSFPFGCNTFFCYIAVPQSNFLNCCLNCGCLSGMRLSFGWIACFRSKCCRADSRFVSVFQSNGSRFTKESEEKSNKNTIRLPPIEILQLNFSTFFWLWNSKSI